jgi:membrane protease YdiL (CAAX protease family)
MHHQKRSPLNFFILTFLYSWGIWLPSILVGLGLNLNIDALTYTAITIPIGAFAPLFAAITLIVKRHGWKEAWAFIKQGFNFKVKPIYLALAILIPLVIHTIAHYLSPLFGLEVAKTLLPDNLPVPPIVLAIPYFFLMLIIGGGQEEFGWRGYALDPLQEKFGTIPASLLIGLIWGLWHLPLWIMPGDGHSSYPYIAFVIMTTSISLVYSWLYNASGKMLIVTLFLHAMSNTAAPLIPFLHMQEGKPETAYWVYAGVNVIAGLICAFLINKDTKSKNQ